MEKDYYIEQDLDAVFARMAYLNTQLPPEVPRFPLFIDLLITRVEYLFLCVQDAIDTRAWSVEIETYLRSCGAQIVFRSGECKSDYTADDLDPFTRFFYLKTVLSAFRNRALTQEGKIYISAMHVLDTTLPGLADLAGADKDFTAAVLGAMDRIWDQFYLLFSRDSMTELTQFILTQHWQPHRIEEDTLEEKIEALRQQICSDMSWAHSEALAVALPLERLKKAKIDPPDENAPEMVNVNEEEIDKLVSDLGSKLGILITSVRSVSDHPDVDVNKFLKNSEQSPDSDARQNGLPEILVETTTDLTSLAERGMMDPLVGREDEIEQMFFILSCRRKNKVLVLGDPGSGKSALIGGLATRIQKGEAPAFLKGCRVLRLRVETLISRYRGAFAEKFASIIAALHQTSHVLLVLDNVHTMLEGNEENSAEQLNALSRLLEDAQIPVVISTTHKMWRQRLSDAMKHYVQSVELKPLSEEEAVKVIEGLKGRYEEFHRVHYGEGVVREAVKLATRFIVDRSMPDVAVDVIDQLAARERLEHEKEGKSSESEELLEVGTAGLPAVVANIARLPVDQVYIAEESGIENLDRELRARVFGQDTAIDALVSAIKVSRSGLVSGERPMGSFLFTGPTGVGKTEVARQLAKSLNVPLLRFDMSEFSESFTVSRLIGSPAGYVGYGEGGQLTEQVTKNPYSVVLLDEIEKAHPTLFNLLLQVMDHGKLTDGAGREADFRNVILIMTSNVGARESERLSIGFGAMNTAGDFNAALKQVFTPEFRNRFDRIVQFSPLSAATIRLVIDKFLDELTQQLKARNVTVSYSEELKAFLQTKGFEPSMGARPMRRLIDGKIRQGLADALLFGELKNGGHVDIDYADEEVKFSFSSN